MYIKFDENGKLYAFSYSENAPSEAYIYSPTDYAPEELTYVVMRNGVISLDEAAMKRNIKKMHVDNKIRALKAELEKIKEDIEQQTFGLVRDDYAVKKRRAAEIVNELRVLEGKEPRELKEEP